MTEWERLQAGLVYNDFGCVILDCAEVTIGSHTLLGPNIGLYPVNHSTDATEVDKTDYLERMKQFV